ncbi:hypothetical protein HOH87_07520 [bacterium]|jgi:hypothetical protein|nr:hypothetical protein [bacterium]
MSHFSSYISHSSNGRSFVPGGLYENQAENQPIVLPLSQSQNRSAQAAAQQATNVPSGQRPIVLPRSRAAAWQPDYQHHSHPFPLPPHFQPPKTTPDSIAHQTKNAIIDALTPPYVRDKLVSLPHHFSTLTQLVHHLPLNDRTLLLRSIDQTLSTEEGRNCLTSYHFTSPTIASFLATLGRTLDPADHSLLSPSIETLSLSPEGLKQLIHKPFFTPLFQNNPQNSFMFNTPEKRQIILQTLGEAFQTGSSHRERFSQAPFKDLVIEIAKYTKKNTPELFKPMKIHVLQLANSVPEIGEALLRAGVIHRHQPPVQAPPSSVAAIRNSLIRTIENNPSQSISDQPQETAAPPLTLSAAMQALLGPPTIRPLTSSARSSSNTQPSHALRASPITTSSSHEVVPPTLSQTEIEAQRNNSIDSAIEKSARHFKNIKNCCQHIVNFIVLSTLGLEEHANRIPKKPCNNTYDIKHYPTPVKREGGLPQYLANTTEVVSNISLTRYSPYGTTWTIDLTGDVPEESYHHHTQSIAKAWPYYSVDNADDVLTEMLQKYNHCSFVIVEIGASGSLGGHSLLCVKNGSSLYLINNGAKVLQKSPSHLELSVFLKKEDFNVMGLRVLHSET